MGLEDIIKAGVQTANLITKSLHVPVIHRAWIGQSPYGEAMYAATSVGADGQVLRGLVEIKQTTRALPNGLSSMSKATVMFIEPVPPNGAAGRTEPVDVRDYIELPNGISGPILDVEGLLNPDTDEPYFTEVWLGA
jgi:hypothetical protein